MLAQAKTDDELVGGKARRAHSTKQQHTHADDRAVASENVVEKGGVRIIERRD